MSYAEIMPTDFFPHDLVTTLMNTLKPEVETFQANFLKQNC